MLALAGWLAVVSVAGAEETPPATAEDDLSIEQARLADRFDRLEVVIGRLAELSAGTDPRRARLLREAIAQSRQLELNERFETVVSLLEDERLSAAAEGQAELQNQLDSLLALLLKADRDREIESETRRIREYLREVGRLIRLQQGLRAQTEGGDELKRLADEQQQAADQTGKLGRAITETEGSKGERGKQGKDGDQQKDNSAEPDEKRSADENRANEPAEGEPADSNDGEPSQPGESKPGRSNSSPPSGRPQDGGQPSADGEQPPSQQPADRAAERLRAAQQRMEEARRQLDQTQRDDAVEQQREAIRKLEQAKAELERVLRQLREEEMERTLTLLAARFRKMLEAQVRVYDGTVRLDRVPESARDHAEEIEAARLSREESLIVREAEKALMLLREEGSSVAFPEAVEQMRDDMQQVARWLSDFQLGLITQELEQDIIAALEETIAALEQELKNLEKNRTPPGQSPAGQPTEPPLVAKLAELKMIRSLQVRINRRTVRYGEMIDAGQEESPELWEALQRLAERQQRVHQATYDLSQGLND